MKREKWKAIVLCLALFAVIAGFLKSRERFTANFDPTAAMPGPVRSNAPATPATGVMDVPTLNLPTGATPREEVVGVGLMLRMDNESGELLVAGLVPNSPATEAGLAGNVRIRKIDDTPTAGMKLRECVELLRGTAGSKVRLEVFDADANETRVVELTRRKLQL